MQPIGDSTTPIEYRNIPGFPGYRVGDDGSVWSSRNYGRDPERWRRLKPTVKRGKVPYLVVGLRAGSTGPVSALHVHSLVLGAFGPARPEGCICCHNDGDPANNRIGNLRWGTYASNSADTRKHGRQWSKLQPKDILELRRMAREGVAQPRLAERFGISQATVSRIILGKAWAHIQEQP